jgi:hypothetical protein
MEKHKNFSIPLDSSGFPCPDKRIFFRSLCPTINRILCVCVSYPQKPLNYSESYYTSRKIEPFKPTQRSSRPPYLLRKLSGPQKCSLSLFFFLMPVLSNLNRGVEGKMHRSGHPRYDITSFIFFFKIIIKK